MKFIVANVANDGIIYHIIEHFALDLLSEHSGESRQRCMALTKSGDDTFGTDGTQFFLNLVCVIGLYNVYVDDTVNRRGFFYRYVHLALLLVVLYLIVVCVYAFVADITPPQKCTQN